MKHIPVCSTLETEVLAFEDALLGAFDENEEYDVNKWLYVPCFYSEYRYILGTRGKHPLICIGINPSTAKPDKLDRTLSKVQTVALGNGFDSFIMFNVYSQRATDPNHMEKCFNEKMHRENMKAFRYVLSLSESVPSVWAAWGANITKRDYLAPCVRDMLLCGNEFGAVWYTAGERCAAGHPRHPLYLRNDTKIERFSDVGAYLDSLCEE